MPLILQTLPLPASNTNFFLWSTTIGSIGLLEYIILSFLASFNFCFQPKSMHFVLSSTRWILNLLSTNHSYKLVKSLFQWCSTVWTSLCWNVKPESSANKNKLEWTAWGISLTCSKNIRGSKIDPWRTPQKVLDKFDKWLFMLTLNTLSYKYDLNHVIDFSEKPIASNLPRRISRFIVSKTFLKSN